MIVTIRVPGLRSLGLVLVGIVVGATLVAPVAARVTGPGTVVPATIYTRSASCAGLDFYPTDSATHYANAGTLRFVTSYDPGASGVFRCDPGLPTGAVVTKVQFTLRAEAGDAHVFCSFVRSGLTFATATTSQQLAGPVFGHVGLSRVSDTTIDHATIDNAKWGYWLECLVEGGGPVQGIYGADVTYTISAANG